jgi:predicted DNA-binding helix-hairpin-helix protein
MGVVLKRAKYFITCNELPVYTVQEAKPEYLRQLLTQPDRKKRDDKQLIIQWNADDAD